MAKRLLSAVWRVNRFLPLVAGVLLALNAGIFIVTRFVVVPEVRAVEERLAGSLALANSPLGIARAQAALFRKAETDLAEFRRAIPAKEQFTVFLAELFSLAGGAGLTLDRITYSPKDDAESGLLHYPLSFSVQGDYVQIKKFIHSLEQSPRIIAIEEISLSGSSSETTHGNRVSLSMRLTTYFQADR